MAALKVPKAFLGYEEGVGSKATLAAEDVRFSRTIERLQKIVCSELEKLAVIHLFTQGFDETELLNFELELTNPSMIHEQEKLELLSQQQELASSLMENKLMSREWIYENIFNLDSSQKKKMYDGVIEDQKQAFRMEQITVEGNDPFKTGEKDMGSAMGGAAGGEEGGGGGFGAPSESDWGGSEPDRFKKDINPHGAKKSDLKKATSYERSRNGSREFKGGSPLATSKGATLVKSEQNMGVLSRLKKKYGKSVSGGKLLNEKTNLFDES